MRRWTRRTWRMLAVRFFSAIGACAVVVSVVAPLSPLWWQGQLWVIVAVIVIAVVWAARGLRRREPTQKYRENVTIRLVLGDLFDQDASAVVGMTTTFDTLVPDVISPTSVQGVLLDRVYGGSCARLDADLDALLANILPVGTIEKEGKRVLYPLSTVVTLSPPGSIRYYCAAYTTMDALNRATGSIRGLLDALDNCWDAADSHGNGAPICVPLIGQGQFRVPELTAEIAVRLIAFSFLLRTRRSRFARELRIVVHPDERDKIDAAEFQAFLTSLGAE
jgi:hypothetical protein